MVKQFFIVFFFSQYLTHFIAAATDAVPYGKAEPPVSTPGGKITVAEIRTYGNDVTRHNVITKYCAFSVGDQLTQAELERRIERTRQNLENTFFFRRVNVYDLPRSDPNRAVILVAVRERSPWSFSADFWKVGVAKENIGGRALRIGATVGVNRIEFDLKQPWFFGSDFVFGGNVFYENDDRIEIENYGGVPGEYFGVETVGVTGGVGYNFNSTDSFGAGLLWERRNFYDESIKSDPFERLGIDDTTNLVTLRPYLEFNRRDVERTPTSGIYTRVSAEIADKALGVYTYRKVECDVRYYVTPRGVSTLAFRGVGGYSTDSTPYFKRFGIEGLEMLRAVDYNNVVGSRMLVGSFEVRRDLFRIPIFNAWFEGAAFFDVGRTWDPGEPVELKGMAYGYGPALRLHVREPFVLDARAEATFSKSFNGYLSASHGF